MFNILAASTEIAPVFILLTLVLLSVVIVSLILLRFKQSLLVGYFVCGLILNNSGVLDWAGAGQGEVIAVLAEFGVVLLLFTLGVEFSVKEMKALKRPVLLGGGLQVFLCILVALGAGVGLGLTWPQALLLGFAFSLSSTAVSMKLFQELGLPASPQARVALGMAIFQDLAAIFFMVLIPSLLSGNDGGESLLWALLKGVGFTVGIILLSRRGFPQMLDAVAKTRSRELFTVTVVGLCVAVALASGLLGLSPALGAFAAGVVVSESIYSHRVLSEILPFKDLFLTVFFVSVGLLVDINVLQENWLLILGLTLLGMFVKGAIVSLAALLCGLRRGSWITTAAALASTGEFSIVLLARAADFEAFTPLWEQVLLACTAVSMGGVPSLMRMSLGWSDKMRRSSKTLGGVAQGGLGMSLQVDSMYDHVVICGFGPVGRNLYQNLKRAGVDVIVLETNPETVKQLLNEGVMSLFADAADRVSLELAHLERARIIAFTFPAEEVVIKAMEVARELNPEIRVYARSKFTVQAERLQRAGVDAVLHDEEQSGKAMIQSVMQCYAADIVPEWELK